MKQYLGNIHEKVWDVTKEGYIILNEENLTPNDRINKQCNTVALDTIYRAIDDKIFEQIKDLEKTNELWISESP
jgi:hypothetical protein